jgi:hypothetical protein
MLMLREVKGETSIGWKTRGHAALTGLRQGSSTTLLQHGNGDVGVVIAELHTETLE